MKVAVIGAGPAGLTAAYELARAGVSVEVFESDQVVGGMARTIRLWDQAVDLGPHRFFSTDERVNRLWLEMAGEDHRMVNRLTRIYYRRRLFYYPLQAANALWNMGILQAVRCVGSYLKEKVRPSHREAAPENFESWVVSRFGRRLYEMFFKSYSEKLWGISCQELDADFAAQRIKKFSLGEAIKNALGLGGGKHKTLVDQFAYPIGGSGMIYERMAEGIRRHGGQVHLGSPVGRVCHRDRQIVGLELPNGEFVPCDHVISTMPLTLMVRGLGELPAPVAHAVDELGYRNTILVYLHVDSDRLFPDQWLYVHSPELLVGRVTNFRNWVPQLYGAASSSILAMEYWCNHDEPLWQQADAELIALARQEIDKTGLLGDARVLDGHVVRLNRSYPVYRCGYREHVAKVVDYLQGFQGLTAIGRYGAFKYNNQDHSILMGLLAAENLLGRGQHSLWSINTDYETYQEAGNAAALRKGA